MKKLFQVYIVTLICLLQACKQETAVDLSVIYHAKSAEIVAYVLSETDYCDCILEPSNASFVDLMKIENPGMDSLTEKMKMMKRLHIQRLSTLDSMVALSKRFDLRTSAKNTNFKIIRRNGLDTITHHRTYLKWLKTVRKQCPEGLCHIDKPIFNRAFNRVSFDIELGGGCLPVPPKVFEYKNGAWFYEDWDNL